MVELLKSNPPEIFKSQEVVAKLHLFKERFDPTFSRFLSSEIKKAQTLRPELSELVEVGAEFALGGGKRLRPAKEKPCFKSESINFGMGIGI